MAKPVWQQKLQARLDKDPLFWIPPTAAEKAVNIHAPSRICCAACGGKGKRVTLREVVNYSMNRCDFCGWVCR